MGKMGPPSGVEGVTLQTDLNGEFLFPKVLPGRVLRDCGDAGLPSARAMFTDKEIEDRSPEMRQLVGRALNRVQVDTGHTERVQVRMERGSAVSGTVHFDDGSLAIGVPVKLLKGAGQLGGDEADCGWDVLGQADGRPRAVPDRGMFRRGRTCG